MIYKPKIENIFVIGRKIPGFRGDAASAATLMDADLKDIPLNISVIPSGLIELVNSSDTRRIIEQSVSAVTRTNRNVVVYSWELPGIIMLPLY